MYRGAEYTIDTIPKIKVEVLAEDADESAIIDLVIAASRSGRIGDGKVWTTEVGTTSSVSAPANGTRMPSEGLSARRITQVLQEGFADSFRRPPPQARAGRPRGRLADRALGRGRRARPPGPRSAPSDRWDAGTWGRPATSTWSC